MLFIPRQKDIKFIIIWNYNGPTIYLRFKCAPLNWIGIHTIDISWCIAARWTKVGDKNSGFLEQKR